MPRIRLDFKSVKRMFFDQAKVKRKVDAASRKVLSKFGAYVRKTSKQSIKKRKGTSKPGKPPFSHVGTLKRFIFFGYDVNKQSVVIGPVIFPGKSGKALPALEYGGKSDTFLGTTIHVEARPFMGPAFKQNLALVPTLWAESIK